MPKPVWELFPLACEKICNWHREVGLTGSGHDFWHAVRVATMALKIAEDESTGKLAAFAGLCHNADRGLAKANNLGRRDVPKEMVTDLVETWLADSPFADFRRANILEAVLRHDQANKTEDSEVQITLMDADRLVNIQADVIMRSGQFYPDLAVYDPVLGIHDPRATFREPRSIVRDLIHNLEWMGTNNPFSIRLPKARNEGKAFEDFLLGYIARVEGEFQQAGLSPETLPSWLK